MAGEEEGTMAVGEEGATEAGGRRTPRLYHSLFPWLFPALLLNQQWYPVMSFVVYFVGNNKAATIQERWVVEWGNGWVEDGRNEGVC